MEFKFISIVSGPREYVKDGLLVEDFVIAQDEIDEAMNEDVDFDTEEDAIKYLIEEEIDIWQQRFCTCIIIPESKRDILKSYLNH
jgi:hypothetical protein